MNIFKIVLPGSRVRNSRLAEDVVNSLYPNPKINAAAQPPHAGIIFLNWNSSSIALSNGTVKILYSFPHGYDYIPSCFASYSFDNGSTKNKGTLPFQVGAYGIVILDADSSNINLKYVSFDSGIPANNIPTFIMQVRFYVMAERGHE